jgi:uncharacterized lipoprotein YbaY
MKLVHMLSGLAVAVALTACAKSRRHSNACTKPAGTCGEYGGDNPT